MAPGLSAELQGAGAGGQGELYALGDKVAQRHGRLRMPSSACSTVHGSRARRGAGGPRQGWVPRLLSLVWRIVQAAEKCSTSCRGIGWGWLDFVSGACPSSGLDLLAYGVQAFVLGRAAL